MTSGTIEISAAVCRGFGAPLSIETLRLAPPQGSEIRVRVRASSICHSDITYMDGGWGGADSLPAVFGHELAGVVTDLGPAVPPGSIGTGDRVLVSLLRSCGRCARCEAGSPAQCTAAFAIDSAPRLSDEQGRPVRAGLRVGGFAESVVVDVSQAVTIPAGVADEAACVVSCGVMTGFGAAINTARVQAGDAVAVIGCGGVGLNCVQGAALAGALPLIAIDVDADKLAQARAFGATDALDATHGDVAAEALALTEGRGFDAVMTAVGSARAIEQALPLLARDGALVVVGMPPYDERVSLDATTLAHFGQRIPVNIVDNLEGSDFITPAIVDRDPVTVAIGTGGTAPALARSLKAAFEAQMPLSLGPLARIGQAFRSGCERVPSGRMRRALWSEYFSRLGPRRYAREGESGAREALRTLLDEAATAPLPDGLVSFVGAGPGDPELLTLKARNLLHEADIVVHDRLVSAEVLELARRDAERVSAGKSGYGPSWPQARINALMVRHAKAGRHVVRLKSGDPAVFGRLDEEMEALEGAGIPWEVVPGITAAAGAAADMGVSLTRRGRNSELRLLTARDVEGFAEQDWAALARPGSVAAIYMGKRAAAFLRGRMLMRGAAPSTPVTIVENASRQDKRVVATTLLRLPEVLEETHLAGPVVLMLGIVPRDAMHKANEGFEGRRKAV